MQTSQRLTTFNFYIVISSLITTGMAATLIKRESQNLAAASFLGFGLIVLSGIFWKLDERNRDLIRGAEDALKFFESNSQLPDIDGVPHVAKRFLREEYDTRQKVSRRTWRRWRNQYKYSDCFVVVFRIFTGLGILSIIMVLIKWSELDKQTSAYVEEPGFGRVVEEVIVPAKLEG